MIPAPHFSSTPAAPSGERRDRPSIVLAAVDLTGDVGPTPMARRVLRVAQQIAHSRGADLHVVHAWTLVGESLLSCPIRGIGPHRLRKLYRGVARTWYARLEEICIEELGALPSGAHVLHGSPRAVIPALARRLDPALTVVGISERGPVLRFLTQSVIDEVLERLDCDVLALRAPTPEPLDILEP